MADNKKRSSSTKKPVTAKKTSTRKSASTSIAATPAKHITSVASTPAKRRNLQIKRSWLITGGVILVLLALFYFTKNLFIVATVNGQPISRLSVIRELEQQGGKQTLNAVITKTLITQEANKRGITVSKADLDNEYKRIDRRLKISGQSFDEALKASGITRAQLDENTRLTLMLQKMVGKVNVSAQEVQDYIDKNKETLPKNINEAELKWFVKDTLEQTKQQEKFQPLIKDLQTKARINYWVNY